MLARTPEAEEAEDERLEAAARRQGFVGSALLLQRLHRFHGGGTWFAIVTELNRESLAVTGIERLGVQVYQPIAISRRVFRGKLVDRQSPLFARYLFAMTDKCRLAEIVAVPAVVGALPLGREPEPVPVGAVKALQEREANGEFRFSSTASGKRRRRRVLRSLRELDLWQEAIAA
jgi:hypothetical protein